MKLTIKQKLQKQIAEEGIVNYQQIEVIKRGKEALRKLREGNGV